VPVEEQVVSIFTGTRGFLDRVQITDVTRFEGALLGELRAKEPELLAAIRSEREISPAVEKRLDDFLDGFARTFA
jgi:F-type H+-transporting ATPase subunit alpha